MQWQCFGSSIIVISPSRDCSCRRFVTYYSVMPLTEVYRSAINKQRFAALQCSNRSIEFHLNQNRKIETKKKTDLRNTRRIYVIVLPDIWQTYTILIYRLHFSNSYCACVAYVLSCLSHYVSTVCSFSFSLCCFWIVARVEKIDNRVKETF